MPDQHVSASEVAALTQRVTGVEAAVESIRKDIHGLVSKFDERTRTPWGTLLAGAGLLFTVMSTFVTMLVAAVAWGLLSQNANMVKSLDEFKAANVGDRILFRQDIDTRFARVDGILARSVPREEHEQIWAADAQRFLELQRQLDETKAALGSTYSLRDYIARLTQRLDTLEERALSRTETR